jgi:sugar phosphate isomerase/epimerase
MASVRPAGGGEGQLPELLRELDTNNYNGYLVIEPHLQHRLPNLDGSARFAVALTALRTLLGEMN